MMKISFKYHILCFNNDNNYNTAFLKRITQLSPYAQKHKNNYEDEYRYIK